MDEKWVDQEGGGGEKGKNEAWKEEEDKKKEDGKGVGGVGDGDDGAAGVGGGDDEEWIRGRSSLNKRKAEKLFEKFIQDLWKVAPP